MANQLLDLHELFPWNELEIIKGVEIEGKDNTMDDVLRIVLWLETLVFFLKD